jgi:hypothetical protein
MIVFGPFSTCFSKLKMSNYLEFKNCAKIEVYFIKPNPVHV